MGDRTERGMVQLERKMEWRRERRTEALHHGLSAHCRSHARGGRGQFDLGLARELARRTGTKVERVRELFSGRELLRLGRTQRLRADHATYTRWDGKFRIQNARSLSASDKVGARKTGYHRRVRLRFAQSPYRCCALDADRAGRSFL